MKLQVCLIYHGYLLFRILLKMFKEVVWERKGANTSIPQVGCKCSPPPQDSDTGPKRTLSG